MFDNWGVKVSFMGSHCELFELEEGGGGRDKMYSCVALCRKDWSEGVPALGGTRWFNQGSPKDARREVIALASAMYFKNRLLANAANFLDAKRGLPGELSSLYRWQGGKGVIWAPKNSPVSPELRLRLHGRLVNALRGAYIASKDQGVGAQELAIIAEETDYTIGLRCGRDTGEATAIGVVAGAEQVLAEVGSSAKPLVGRNILVSGIGKVGLPLVRLLDLAGASVWIFEPALIDKGGVAPAIDAHFAKIQSLGGALEEGDLNLLQKINGQGRVFTREAEALRYHELDLISPNGGATEWMSGQVEGVTRAELIASRGRSRRVRFILGAANDQLTVDAAAGPKQAMVLETLRRANWLFVPDPLVSPGGVIAVSHEPQLRNNWQEWRAQAVNRDAREVVKVAVARFIHELKIRSGGIDHMPADVLLESFRSLVEGPWDE